MIVKIKEQMYSFPLKGDVYKAQRYWLDPTEKVTLLCKLDPETLEPLEEEQLICNEYINNVEILN